MNSIFATIAAVTLAAPLFFTSSAAKPAAETPACCGSCEKDCPCCSGGACTCDDCGCCGGDQCSRGDGSCCKGQKAAEAKDCCTGGGSCCGSGCGK